MRNYTTQMDAARKGILTPEIETVAKKEHMPVEKLMQLVAEGKVAICANKNHTCLAEAIGTGFLGALAAYPVALYLMGIAPAGLFVYVVPFLISTVAGSILAFILITVLEKSGVMSQIREA